jgi:hypothetical protein
MISDINHAANDEGIHQATLAQRHGDYVGI